MIKIDIQLNADRITRYLQKEKKEIPVSKLKEDLSLSDEDCNFSIGWLAKEEKVFIAFRGNDMFLTDVNYLCSIFKTS
jgi:hypothetical protein